MKVKSCSWVLQRHMIPSSPAYLAPMDRRCGTVLDRGCTGVANGGTALVLNGRWPAYGDEVLVSL